MEPENAFLAAIDLLIADKTPGICFGEHYFSPSHTPNAHVCAAACSCPDEPERCLKEIFNEHGGIIDLIAVDTGAGETFIQPRMQELLTNVEASKSQAIGVGGTVQKATVKGRMIVHLKDVKTGRVYDMDLGMGHVLNSTPVSILSVSKLIPTEMRFHFEKDNNYCTPPEWK